jgi:hypothetical protein
LFLFWYRCMYLGRFHLEKWYLFYYPGVSSWNNCHAVPAFQVEFVKNIYIP